MEMDLRKVGRKLVSLRGARSRAEAADGIGISVSALAMYELGRRSPRDDIKIKIAQYYGTNVGKLFYCE